MKKVFLTTVVVLTLLLTTTLMSTAAPNDIPRVLSEPNNVVELVEELVEDF
ncbi:MAG: hypothetical protein GX971_11350 [Firmicutes bacterium]|nr:hypothetical protein [Bacillota bacterium]